jgi:glycosyltransferase involved in cell wall biosynthesis
MGSAHSDHHVGHDTLVGDRAGPAPEPAEGAVAPIRSVTLVVPMLDEARHVASFVADVAAQDYDGPIELVVADGGSSDGSRELLLEAATRAGVELTLLDNPDRYVSHGLNRCIAASSGDLVVRLDLHTRYQPDYVRLCVEASNATGAWNVGGVLVPRGTSPTERAVAAAMDGPFGGIGWTSAASAGGRAETDTVPFGAFRREALDAVGGYDEALVRNQDDELNLRLRRAGGKVVLDPGIRAAYVPRGRLRDVVRQYYEYGLWKVPVMRKHRASLGLRSLVPAAFVVLLMALVLHTTWLEIAETALLVVVGTYLTAAAVFGAHALRRRGESLRLLPRVVGAFVAFHFGYGIGMLRGFLRWHKL